MNTASLARGLALVVTGLASALALWFGYEALVEWTFRGLTPGARDLLGMWPLAFYASLALGAIASLGVGLRGAASSGLERVTNGLGAFALISVGWSLCVLSASALPAFASAADLGNGPVLIPLYLALSFVCVAVATVWPRGLAIGERALLLFVLWGACNGKLFSVDVMSGFGLTQLGGMVAVVLMSSDHSLGSLWANARTRIGRGTLLVFVLLPIWWLLAALDADRAAALQLVWRIWLAALVTIVALGTPWRDPLATGRRVLGALLAGLGLVLVATCLGLAEAANFEPWSAVLNSRLRVLGLHPNLGAALFAAGLPLAMGWLGLGGRKRDLGIAAEGESFSIAQRLGAALLIAGAVLVLVLSGSRASVLGALAGVLVLGVALWTPLCARIGIRTWIGVFALAGLAVVLLVSPLGEGLRATLDAKANTQSAIGQRWHIWRMAGTAVREAPLFGLGPSGFAGHAQYAQPSYYDGTSQVLHTHNVFLAAAEGAGWIGLGLFCAFLIGLLEGLRRAALRVPRQGAALLAAVIALLVCNQLDLGQSQTTMIPYFFWAAAVCAGLWSGAALPSPAASRGAGSALLAPALMLVLLWPSTGSILVADMRLKESGQLISRNQDQAGIKLLEGLISPLFLVNENLVSQRLTGWARRERNADAELRFCQMTLDKDTQTPVLKRRYAQALVHWGHFDAGVEMARQALAADPYGEDADGMRVLIAWSEIGAGDVRVGMRHLAEALVGGARLPDSLERRLDGEDFNASMRAELHQLGAEIVAEASVDERRARRRLAGLTDAFRDFGDASAAVPYLRGVIDNSAHPIRATYYQLIVLLRSLGRDDEARDVWKASPYADEVNFQAVFAGLDEGTDAGAGEATGAELDLFFIAGRLVQRHMARARELAQAGDVAGSRWALRRALYNATDEAARVGLVLEFMHYGMKSKEDRLWQVRRYLERASVVRKRTRDHATLNDVINLAAAAWGSPQAVYAALGSDVNGLGVLGETLRGVVGP